MAPHLEGQCIDNFIGYARVNGQFPDALATRQHPWATVALTGGHAQ
jgi:hypothetical protein